jgi:hypothetical protein
MAFDNRPSAFETRPLGFARGPAPQERGGRIPSHQRDTDRVTEIEDVEARGRLVESIAIAPGIEAEQAAEENPDRRLVRHHEHALAGVARDDLPDHGQCPREHGHAGLAALRSERERILLP